jgi:inosose dehydratase
MKVANAPCSWGILEFDMEGETAGYLKVLYDIQQTSYVGTELRYFVSLARVR